MTTYQHRDKNVTHQNDLSNMQKAYPQTTSLQKSSKHESACTHSEEKITTYHQEKVLSSHYQPWLLRGNLIYHLISQTRHSMAIAINKLHVEHLRCNKCFQRTAPAKY
ncbi:hypothetical protein CICLE_v10022977mg [Citrus x clementina]|uniref:Uncharacterized protein n=1 Tax=Citrus clementina TaxID=85681 RepID=V4TQM0_CITCL|nr:hypothetical protein CICLE_v10022977mg [Citrus x clementina]